MCQWHQDTVSFTFFVLLASLYWFLRGRRLSANTKVGLWRYEHCLLLNIALGNARVLAPKYLQQVPVNEFGLQLSEKWSTLLFVNRNDIATFSIFFYIFKNTISPYIRTMIGWFTKYNNNWTSKNVGRRNEHRNTKKNLQPWYNRVTL